MFQSYVLFMTSFLPRRRLNARIAELEDGVAQAQARAGKLEKDKNRLSIEIREITVELETVCSTQNNAFNVNLLSTDDRL